MGKFCGSLLQGTPTQRDTLSAGSTRSKKFTLALLAAKCLQVTEPLRLR